MTEWLFAWHGLGLATPGALIGFVAGLAAGVAAIALLRPSAWGKAGLLLASTVLGTYLSIAAANAPQRLRQPAVAPAAAPAASRAEPRHAQSPPAAAARDTQRVSVAPLNEGELCTHLNALHRALDLDELKRRAANGLPIVCQGVGWLVGLQDELALANTPLDAARQARILDWLRLLWRHDVPLNQPAPHDQGCLLDRVVQRHGAEVLLFALDIGCDANAVPTGPHDWPAVARWAVRRHRLLADCPRTAPMSREQIAAVDARMPPLSAAQINRGERGNGRSLFHAMAEFVNCSDGGAAFFEHLVAQGGDPGRAADGLIGQATLHPALAAALMRLGPEQIQRLANPLPHPGFDTSYSPQPLIDSARRAGNLALVDVLCARRLKGC